MKNGMLIIESNLPIGTYCQWSILAQDDDSYVILEFQTFNVRNIIALKEWFNCVNSDLSKLL